MFLGLSMSCDKTKKLSLWNIYHTFLKKENRWNLQKPGGWQTYKAEMDKATAMIDEVTENVSLNVEDMMKRNDSIMKKVKFKALESPNQ